VKILPRSPKQIGRRNTFLRGTIYTPGKSPMPCAVRDLSLSGARLTVASSAPLPSMFHLVVEASNFGAHCKVVQRSGDRVDVVFLD
jgi:hypothetical protein